MNETIKTMLWAVLPVFAGLVLYNTVWPRVQSQLMKITG